jgi:hypothetical protein
MLCSRCNSQLLDIDRFRHEIEEQQRAYKSIDCIKFEPNIKLECDTFDNSSVFVEPISSTTSDFVQIKAEHNESTDNEDEDVAPFKFETKRKHVRKGQTPKGTRKSAFLYRCDFCHNFTADNKKDYADHIKLNHALNSTKEQKDTKVEESRPSPFIVESIALKDTSPVECDYCGLIKKNKRLIIQHMKVHSQLEVKCSECEKSFKDTILMTRHKNRCHNDGRDKVWCTCGQLFNNQRDARKCRISHKKKPEKTEEISNCDECEKEFSNVRQLLNHKNKFHSNGKRFWCIRCSSMYTTKEEQTNCVKSHYNDSLKDVLVKCPICSKEMLHNSLKVHMKSTHSTVREAVCHQCGKSFVTVSRLTIHVRQVHNNGLKPYQCAHCPQRTALKKAMKEHLFKRHASQRKTYQCPICLKVTQENLERHMTSVHPNGYDNGIRVNPETNMYHCPNCVQQFTQLKRYEQHINEKVCENYGDYEFQAGENGKFSVSTKGR